MNTLLKVVWWASMLMPMTGTAEPALDELIARSAAQHGVPELVLKSVVSHESGNPNQGFKLNPYALNIRGYSVYPESKADAYRRILKEVILGEKTVGIGLGQVEWRYHQAAFTSWWDALEPERNLAVTAKYLKKMIDRCGGVACGVAAYHNRNKIIGQQYLTKVASRCQALYGKEACDVLRQPL